MKERTFYQQRFFVYLVAYRWGSLLVPLWSLWLSPQRTDLGSLPYLVLFLAIAHTAFITIFHRPLNRMVMRWPVLLAMDILFCTLLIWLSGGVVSPYYLYALSPLLAAAFFFRYKGAFYGGLLFTPLYILALLTQDRSTVSHLLLQDLPMQLAGIWLLPALVAYPAALVAHLREAHRALARARDDLAQRHNELQMAHRQLSIIHDLTISLQAAPDIETVQQRVLRVLTEDLKFPRAAIGLINPITERLEQWRGAPTGAFGAPPSLSLPLTADFAPLTTWFDTPQVQWWNGQKPVTRHQALNTWLGAGPWIVFPLMLRDHPVGVLLLASHRPFDALPPADQALLTSVAEQAAVVLGTIMLCIGRARRLAIEHERNRIAREMHDSIAQSMFGMVLSLDACVKMLPEHPQQVRQELVELSALASRMREQIRQSILAIWPSELTLERFKADLRKYARHLNRGKAFHLEFNTSDEFDRLSPSLRRSLYRIAQETIANTIRHAQTDTARVCLQVADGYVHMAACDWGRGFDPEKVMRREYNREHFGLRGIQERVKALGGECHVCSRPNAGTFVLVSLPLNERMVYG